LRTRTWSIWADSCYRALFGLMLNDESGQILTECIMTPSVIVQQYLHVNLRNKEQRPLARSCLPHMYRDIYS